jgi:hypothetical protein
MSTPGAMGGVGARGGPIPGAMGGMGGIQTPTLMGKN